MAEAADNLLLETDGRLEWILASSCCWSGLTSYQHLSVNLQGSLKSVSLMLTH